MPFAITPAVILRGYYPDTSLAYFALSDHSRSPLDISYNSFEKSVQLANGTTRKYVIAQKRTIRLNWKDLPSTSVMTADYGAGAKDLEKFYKNNVDNEISIYVFMDQGTGSLLSTNLSLGPNDNGMVGTMPTNFAQALNFTGFIESFSCNVNKRYYGGGTRGTGYYDLWDASLSLKEA